MRILFCTNELIGAKTIRALTWSDWSHTALLLDDNTVVEAIWPKVQRVPLEKVLSRYSAYAIVEIDVPEETEKLIEAAAISQIGKPYDWKALVGLSISRDWQEEDRWFCSELVTWCFAQGGVVFFRAVVMHRIVPQHLWMLPYPIRSHYKTIKGQLCDMLSTSLAAS